MISKSLRISLILALGVSSIQAGFLGEEGEIAAVDPIYATDSAPDSIPGLLEILNARGQQGFQFRGLTTLDSSDSSRRTSLFINDQADSETYSYESFSADSLPANFLTQLTERGAAGFEYIQNFNFSVGSGSVNLYEKRDGSDETFLYRLPQSPTSLNDFLSLLESQGAEGYEWLGVRTLRDASNSAVRHQLFVNRSSDTATYTYRSGEFSDDAQASLNQYNSEGSAGYRWIFSPTIPGSNERYNIYVKSSTRASKFSYNIESSPGSRTEFVTLADSQGSLGRYFKTSGPYRINGESLPSSVFVRESSVAPSAGGIDIATDGQITFTPLESGSFQLQISTGLQSWTNSGAAQMGTAGAAITFNPGVSGTRRFFRVISQ